MKPNPFYPIFILLIFLLQSCSKVQPNVEVTIIETTDLHGHFFNYDFIRNQPATHSLSKISTYVDSIRSINGSNLVLLDNGDLLQGQPVTYFSNVIDTSGLNVGAAVLNYLKYDAASVGNHDIECGHKVFDKVNKQLNCPWLAANAINTKTGEPYFKPYTILYRDGVKIAVLGLITPGIPNWVPEPLWTGMAFEDMVESAKKWVQIIKTKENPDVLIGLFHAGIDPNYNNQNENTYKNENATRLVAERVPGFNLVFAGHDHSAFSGKAINTNGDTVHLLNGGYHAKSIALAKLQLHYDKKQQKYCISQTETAIIDMGKFANNQAFDDTFAQRVESTRKFTSKVVATISKPISTQSAYFGSNEFIDLIHKVQLSASGADVSLAAPLSFNASINAGEIKVADLFQLYKYENLLYVLKMSGAEIDRYMEYSSGLWFNKMTNINDHLLLLKQDEKGQYRLLNQYYNLCSAAGIEYYVDVSKPVGKRVKILGFSDGRQFIEQDTFKVAMNSYRGSGGGGHLEAAGLTSDEIKNRLCWSSDADIRLLMMNWLEQHKTINPGKLNNWRIVPEDYYESGKKRDWELLFGE